jgi:hypothetical protein
MEMLWPELEEIIARLIDWIFHLIITLYLLHRSVSRKITTTRVAQSTAIPLSINATKNTTNSPNAFHKLEPKLSMLHQCS